jgi:hypothetical protein
VIAVVASFDPVTRAEIHKAGQGWMGEARRAREKKSVGRGSDRRCVSSFSSAEGWGLSIRGECYMCFLVDRTVLAIDGLADVGRETSSLLGLPCLLAARELTCIAGS